MANLRSITRMVGAGRASGGSPSGMPVRVVADFDAMSSIGDALDAVAVDVEALTPSLQGGGRGATSGAGEFAASMAPDSAVFVLSWLAALGAYGGSSGVLAGYLDTSARLLTQVDDGLAALAAGYAQDGEPR